MPDKKISELVNLTSLAADDEFVVVDADANATKRTTYDTLATEIRTEAEALTGTTGTFSGDITSNGETVYHRGNILGTVSQSGGEPTGAVIERDSNANGEYVKFADGTMICISAEKNIDVTITAGNIFRGLFASATVWPAGFTTLYLITSSPTSGETGVWGAADADNSTSTFLLRLFAFQSTSSVDGRVIGFGRWF